MAKFRDIPLGNYPSGTRSFGPRAMPNGMEGFDIRIGSCTTATPNIWPNSATRLRLDLQFSYDNGVTYTPIGANSWEQGGGIFTDKLGDEIPERILSWRFDPVQPSHVKGQVTVINGPIRTYLDITIL